MCLRLLSFIFIAASFQLSGIARSQSIRELKQKANEAYNQKEFAECAQYYIKAIDAGDNDPNAWYGAACCFMLDGLPEKAIEYLKIAAQKGFRDPDWVQKDTDLIPLHEHNEWKFITNKFRANKETYLSRINSELFGIFEQDQADRKPSLDKIDIKTFLLRDSIRLDRVTKILQTGGLKAADDYLHAAFIFQHGRDSNAHKMAYELSLKAVELGCSNSVAKWLTAASKDRYLLSIGRPQWYGTQFQISQNGVWILRPIDSTAVSDSQRIELGVPTMSETLKQLKERNKALKSK